MQRRQQRAQRGQIGGEVHVHVGQDGRRRGQPDFPEGVAAALFLEVHHGHLTEFPGHALGGHERAVRARVVRHGDAERVREGAAQVGVEPAQALLQVTFLVVDRDGHVEHGDSGGGVDR